MKCSKCDTKKLMGNGQVRDPKTGLTVPAFICSTCGADVIKSDKVLYEEIIRISKQIDLNDAYFIVRANAYK